jgi:peptidoglycan/LPS O-acetylase OafA/YrhL
MTARVSFLDGIRGWFALVVLLHHLLTSFLFIAFPSYSYTRVDLHIDLINFNYLKILFILFIRFITDGRLAVYIFFCLSGYVLSIRGFKYNINYFYFSIVFRYLRLMIPIFATCFFAYSIFKFDLFYNLELSTKIIALKSWLGFFYNFKIDFVDVLRFSLFDVFLNYQIFSLNSNLWTIQYEFIGSILLYALLLFLSCKNINLKKYLIFLVLLIVISPIYFCFFVGHFLYEFKVLDKKIFSSSINSVILIVFIFLSTISRGDIQSAIYAPCFIYLFYSIPSIRNFFCNKFSLFLGRISFVNYLIQIPIICSYSSFILIKMLDNNYFISEIFWTCFISTVLIILFLSKLLSIFDISFCLKLARLKKMVLR